MKLVKMPFDNFCEGRPHEHGVIDVRVISDGVESASGDIGRRIPLVEIEVGDPVREQFLRVSNVHET